MLLDVKTGQTALVPWGDLMLFSSCSHLLLVVVGCSLNGGEQRGQSWGAPRALLPPRAYWPTTHVLSLGDNHDLFSE